MQATIQYIKKELAELYPETEVQGFIRLIFESVCGWSFTEQILKKEEKLNFPEIQKIEAIIQRLKMHEPIQYIFGETEFYGLNLNLTSSVLIPRPETEELVQWIIESNSFESPRILDIGTGSGCIPLVLKSKIKNASVSGVDISEDALEVAKQNASLNNLEVSFFQTNILDWENYKWNSFDVIVSNPPYVRELEKQEMQTNVLKYEPENALFVSDEDPLIFYRRIAEFAQKYLVKDGKLFFEINEYLGKEMCNLLAHKDFVYIVVKKDMNGKDRMVYCRKKN
ncbi:MAG: peptide chain release factor N(5)-glutamine methyltransferase [Bacteroidetes bacterium]|nr:peptide chain release factor N(5)-glutamine methyltransferase [Bacteroidota bacterium]